MFAGLDDGSTATPDSDEGKEVMDVESDEQRQRSRTRGGLSGTRTTCTAWPTTYIQVSTRNVLQHFLGEEAGRIDFIELGMNAAIWRKRQKKMMVRASVHYHGL